MNLFESLLDRQDGNFQQKNQMNNNISVLIIMQEEVLLTFHLQLSKKLKPSLS
jgi:hypothetical protein